jgi:tRNA dimethylallyltransferase
MIPLRSASSHSIRARTSHTQRKAETPLVPLIVILGPTGVGKTEISISLAERLNGEIVSADSRLFYRGMDIGTAKPTPDARARVPHHLIDIAEPDQTVSLANFQAAAVQAIMDITRRGRLPFLVGGTGQYIRAVTQGWSPPAVAPNPRLRAELERLADLNGRQWLYEALTNLDPPAARGIDPRNVRRSIRALEVILLTGKRFSAQRNQTRSPFRTIQVGLSRPRTELYRRLDARLSGMFEAGLLQEVQHLLNRGYTPNLPSMSAIGYRECCQGLSQGLGVEQIRARIQHNTHSFVRRQANWFKADDPTIRWFDAGRTSVEELEAYLREGLSPSHGLPRGRARRSPRC